MRPRECNLGVKLGGGQGDAGLWRGGAEGAGLMGL